ncbi:MAG: histidine phosphatase family protein [Beijerinckiaceae bacterium]
MTQVIALRGFDTVARLSREIPFRTDAAEFIFVRHGETEGNRTRIFQVPHIPLNDTGEAQAAGAARRLAGTPLVRIVASPMARAWRTASVIGEPHGLVPEADGALSERYYVNLWNTPVPDEELDWGHDPQGCEPISAFVHRVGFGLIRILSDAAHAPRTAIVAHGGILLMLCALTRVTLDDDCRRNGVPLRFSNQSGTWSASPIG